jgi:hypothetical protein
MCVMFASSESETMGQKRQYVAGGKCASVSLVCDDEGSGEFREDSRGEFCLGVSSLCFRRFVGSFDSICTAVSRGSGSAGKPAIFRRRLATLLSLCKYVIARRALEL